MGGGDVTVPGGDGKHGGDGKAFSQHFDSNANAHLARVLAANISAGVLDHSNKHAGSGDSSRGYHDIENRSWDDARSGGNTNIVPKGDNGNRLTEVSKDDNGNWLIETNGGNDTISARGGGNDSIDAGAGHNLIRLGSGHHLIRSSGYDTIHAGTGAETVQATHGSHVVIFAGSSQLTYVGGSASATIVGSKGQEELSGNATLFGGGESGHNRFVAAHGAATMTAGSNSDTFVFSKDAAGGDDVIHHFRQGIDKLDLQGYGGKAVADAIQSQTHPTASSSNLTLSDGTKICFSDVTNIKTTDFKLG